jgi:alcohol dehydrogenase (cytochrome c)
MHLTFRSRVFLPALAWFLAGPALATTTESVQQFEQNPQHLDYLPHTVAPFRLNLKQRIIVLPRYHDGVLYVTTGEGGVHQQGRVVAVSAKTGKLLWTTPVPNIVMTEPVVGENRVVVGLGGNRMYFRNVGYGCYSPYPHEWLALNAKTGKPVWTFKTRCQDMPTPFRAGDLVIGPAGGRRILAVRLRNGKLVWQMNLHGWSAMSSPAVVGPLFYVGLNGVRKADNRFYAIDWKTHTVVWSQAFPTAENLSEPSPVVGGGRVFTAFMERGEPTMSRMPPSGFFPAWDFSVVALNAATGKPLWKRYLYTEYGREPQGLWNNLALFGHLLYRGALAELDQWIPGDWVNRVLIGDSAAKKKAGIHNPPLTYWKGEVFVEPRTAHTLYALDAKTGKILWRYPTQVTIANPNVHDGLLYTVSLHGYLTVLNPKTGKRLFGEQLPMGGVGPTEVLLTKNGIVAGGTNGILLSIPYPAALSTLRGG